MPSRPLDNYEIESMKENLNSMLGFTLFVVGIKTGFRISELLSIQIEDCIQYGAVGNSVTVKRSSMKGKRCSRTVPLHVDARVAITEYIGTRVKGPLFNITRQHAHRLLKQAVEKARLSGKISCHSMRKSFAQNVYSKSGKNILITQNALGHANVSSTQHYLQVDRAEVDQCILD